ncbi:SGNH/GDSL hydrolase family protein [Kolteria novifilia]
MTRSLKATITLLVVGAIAGPIAANEPFLLRDGDRVVLVGDTLLERAQRQGYFETALLSRFPDADVTFRNLAWSADTVNGVSRAYFDAPAKGRERLVEQLKTADPSVLILGYGRADAAAGPDQVETFAKDYRQLLADAAGKETRLHLITPLPQEANSTSPDDLSQRNETLAAYAKAVRELAESTGARTIDLAASDESRAAPLTDNGVHPSPWGYWWLAPEFERLLGLDKQVILVDLDAKGNVHEAQKTIITDIKTPSGGLSFNQLDRRLPTPPLPAHAPKDGAHPWVVESRLRVRDLPEGNYSIAIDGTRVATASARELAQGIVLEKTPGHQQAEELRGQVCRKNRLFFHSYRPQNITYLLGFRKHEQGHNAKEIDELREHVAETEKTINTLRQPTNHQVVIQKESS